MQEIKGTCPEGVFQLQPLTAAASAARTVLFICPDRGRAGTQHPHKLPGGPEPWTELTQHTRLQGSQEKSCKAPSCSGLQTSSFNY